MTIQSIKQSFSCWSSWENIAFLKGTMSVLSRASKQTDITAAELSVDKCGASLLPLAETSYPHLVIFWRSVYYCSIL